MRKNGASTSLYWICERKRDLRCYVSVSTHGDGSVIRESSAPHIHDASNGRSEALIVRRALLDESARRPEAAPSSLLNEHVTADVVLNLTNEHSLKQAIHRRRRGVRPKDPTTAAGLVISSPWTNTLDGMNWYLGEAVVGEDRSYIFATEANLAMLEVS